MPVSTWCLHVVFSVYGYALLDKISVPREISTMLGGGIYPGMLIAPAHVVFHEELDALVHERGVRLDYVIGDHAGEEGRALLSPAHLRKLVPDLDEREVYL